MKRLLRLLVLVPFACALASDLSGPREVAQRFYDIYVHALVAQMNHPTNTASQRAVANSDDLTPAFKKAYAKMMKQEYVDADPVICAQDYPDAGFKSGEAKITGEKASVVLSSRDPNFKHSFTVYLVKTDAGRWLIAGTNDLKPAK